MRIIMFVSDTGVPEVKSPPEPEIPSITLGPILGD
jgi:hypothetical protein